jgi:6-phosphogluconolactonase
MRKGNFNPEIIVVPEASDLAEAGAALFEQTLADAVQRRGQAAAALSGGSTPRAMNRLLAESPFVDRIPWKHIHLFWVDDRMVAVDDPASNFGAARDDFISHVPISPPQVHPMPVLDPPTAGADAYSAELKEYFGSSPPVFDLILLGIGTDGHTASLFPDQAEAHSGREWVLSIKGGQPYVYRLTLNYPVLKRARTTVASCCARMRCNIHRKRSIPQRAG